MSTSAVIEGPEQRHALAHVVFVSLVAAIGGFLFGFDTAVINGAVDALRATFHLSAGMTGLAVSCALLGSALGAASAGRAADRFGRVPMMVVAAGFFAASSLGAGLAPGVWSLVVFRFVGGIGVGIASVIAPAYIAEVAPALWRGRLGSLQQLAIVAGIFVALLSDAFLARSAGGAERPLALGLAAWRWMFLVGIVPSLAYGLLARQIPESPRYLVARGQVEAAASILRGIVGDAAVASRIEAIALTLRRTDRPSVRDLRGPAFGLLPIVGTGVLLSLFQQLVGINVIFYYSTSLWRSVGLSEADAFGVTVVTSVVNVVVTLVAIGLVDKLGRRPLLLFGSAGMALSLATLVVSFARAVVVSGQPTLPPGFDVAALVAANAYVVFFGLSWGPVVWVLLGEMFPNRIRAPALALAAAAQWIGNFAVSISFPVLAHHAGLAPTYGLYATAAALSFFFVLAKVRETKGKELEDMPG
jgi:SP family sugar:H+ symporter-like MFS transporter